MNLVALKECPLFSGITPDNFPELLSCLGAAEKTYHRDDFVFLAGEDPRHVGVVLSGGVRIIQEDFWGNRSILAHAGPGDLFGEVACAEITKLPASVLVHSKSQILLLDYRKIINTCSPTCLYHAMLMQNMVRILANKNLLLTTKMSHLTKRNTREKLLSYLSLLALEAGSNRITVPFSRQDLADYLSVDRSALSRELSRMQQDGLLRYDKNQFVLL
ncbi:MAG: cyclic nucleotide-binding protein [Firmicutes bacterium]|nr:cyclic nucleotide-binding protein [Bacillota bacterium]